MQKIDADITLNFPFNWEYSIDNGTNWATVNADTDVVVLATDLPANKKIKIRSNDTNATRLGYLDGDHPRANISQEEAHFDEVNIRNCGTVTNMSQFFKDIVCDKIIIQRTQNLVELFETFKSSVSRFVYIDELPNANKIVSLFEGAVSGYISPIVVLSDSYTDSRCAFYSANIGIIGGLKVKQGYYGATGAAFKQIFYNCNAKACGNLDLKEYTNTYDVYDGLFEKSIIEKFPSCTLDVAEVIQYPRKFSRAFLFSYSKHNYFPTIKVVNSNSSSYDFFKDAISAYQLGDSSNTSLKFAGFDFKIIASGNGMFQGCQSYVSTKPTKGNFLSKANVKNTNNVIYEDYNYLTNIFYENASDNKRWYYEDPDWFPICRYIDVWTNVEQVKNVKAVGYIRCQPYIYKVNGNNIEIHSSPDYFYGGIHNTLVSMSTIKEVYNNTSNVVVGIQGYTARQEGSDIKIYDKDNTLLSTISGVTYDGATFTWDGLKLYVVTGGTIDRNGNANQNITNIVKVYDVATGNELNELTFLSTETDEYIVGCYQANDDYTLKVAKVKYHNNDGTYEFESAKVESYDLNNGNLLVDTEPVPHDFNLLTQDWIEENEFWLLDTRIDKGNCIRMVGK